MTEPTDLRVATAHKGFEWVEVETRGRAAHGSRPADGRDAILYMGRVLACMEAVDATLQADEAHPRLGTASLHASTIHGGRAHSIYPDRCVLRFERRTVSGEAADAGLAEVRTALAALARADADFDAAPTGMSYWTDAAILGRAGTPAVLFGPAGAGLHGPEEHVRIDSVRVCRDVLDEMIRACC